MIIFGTNSYFRSNKVTQYGFCNLCNHFTTHRSFDAIKFFHLYFIPIIPLGGRARTHKLCSKCEMGQVLPPAAFDEIITRLKSQSADAIVALQSGETSFEANDDLDGSGESIECVPFLHEVMDWLYAAGDGEFCESVIASVSGPENQYAQAMLQAALATLQGDLESAVAAYQQASSSDDRAFLPHYHRAQLLAIQGRTDECIDAYQSAIATADPELETMLRLELAHHQFTAKRFNDAAETYDWLLAHNSELQDNKEFMKQVHKCKKKVAV